jgi:hypothetical protein
MKTSNMAERSKYFNLVSKSGTEPFIENFNQDVSILLYKPVTIIKLSI